MSASEAHLHDAAGSEADIALTNDDAAETKLSCVRRGYYPDPYIVHFVREGKTKKPPLIHRGMFTRVAAIDAVLAQFLRAADVAVTAASSPPSASSPSPSSSPSSPLPSSPSPSAASPTVQVVLLGAGYDTRFWRLSALDRARVHFFEVDVLPVAQAKARVIQREKTLHAALESASFDVAQGRVDSARYSLLACDVRDVAALEAALFARGFSGALPTLFVSECVLCYISAAESAALLAWSARTCADSAVLIYEMMQPHDAFGQVMLANLAQRGVLLASIHAYPTLASQRARLTAAGYSAAEALDLNAVWARVLSAEERQRVARLEPLDEFEELALLQAHYCLVLACKGRLAHALALLPDGRRS